MFELEPLEGGFYHSTFRVSPERDQTQYSTDFKTNCQRVFNVSEHARLKFGSQWKSPNSLINLGDGSKHPHCGLCCVDCRVTSVGVSKARGGHGTEEVKGLAST